MKTKFITFLFTVLAVFLLVGCEPVNHTHKRVKLKKPAAHKQVQHKKETVYILNNGRCAFHDDGFWYYYLIASNNSSSPIYTVNNTNYTFATASTSNTTATMPTGGIWVSSQTLSSQPSIGDISKPGEQLELNLGEVEQNAAQVEQEVPVEANGTIETPTEQVGEQMEFNFSENQSETSTESVDSSDSSTDSSSDTSSDSFSSDSSSSDSGSSGDSGGGDSGGGGDGGE